MAKAGLSENVAFGQRPQQSDEKSFLNPQERAFRAEGTTKVQSPEMVASWLIQEQQGLCLGHSDRRGF